MSIEAVPQTAANTNERSWRPLDRIQRRVAGVLVEKAKTTPDNYPLSLNSLVNGANQKSNRYPQMTIDEEQADRALEELRGMGAVSLIQGDGRVDKYRHLLYDWLGVDKTELAVMAELLLRGAQSLGELRGRAARMERIADIGELRPIVEQLREKQLLVLLTPPGRGCVVTHNLYQPQELTKLRSEHGQYEDDGGAVIPSQSSESPASSQDAQSPVPTGRTGAPASVAASRTNAAPVAAGADQIQTLRNELVEVKRELAHQREEVAASVEQLRREVDDLKQQLGV